MTEKSKLENPNKVKVDDSMDASTDIHGEHNHSTKYGASSSVRHAKSKREIMEELSRERFPWEQD